MLSRRSSLGAAALLATLATPVLVCSAQAQSSQQVTVDGARKVLADLRHDKSFGNAAHLMRQARAVLIVPKLLKGGFIVGGEGGDGVLMVHGHSGWSDPAFYAIGAASFGLQAGLEQSEMILLIMTQKGSGRRSERSVQDRSAGRDQRRDARFRGRRRHRWCLAAGYRGVVVIQRAVWRPDNRRIDYPGGTEPGLRSTMGGP